MVDIVSSTMRAQSNGNTFNSSISSGMSSGGGASSSAQYLPTEKPSLLGKIDLSDKPNDAFLLSNEDGVITVSDDRSLRVWLKRDTGQYWPSIHHSLSHIATCLSYDEVSRRLFVGLTTGLIQEMELCDDYNSVRHVRDYQAHSNAVQAIHFAANLQLLLSCAKDKHFIWHCTETGRKLGHFHFQIVLYSFSERNSFRKLPIGGLAAVYGV